jgi:hypothetical protein
MTYFLTREVTRTFRGQETGNDVILNPLVDKFVLLKELLREDIIGVINDYERIRIKEFYDKTFFLYLRVLL